jgi:general secretion pathway protein G
MKQTFKRNVQKGFTLVELLIVVIILAILAAIVVPQFGASTADANNAAVLTNVATIRSAIELYRAQHNGAYPAATTFVAQMTQTTNAAGTTGCTINTVGCFGPYIRGTTLPADPTNATATLASVSTPTTAGALTTGTGAATAIGAGVVTTIAYGYDASNGQFISTRNPSF